MYCGLTHGKSVLSSQHNFFGISRSRLTYNNHQSKNHAEAYKLYVVGKLNSAAGTRVSVLRPDRQTDALTSPNFSTPIIAVLASSKLQTFPCDDIMCSARHCNTTAQHTRPTTRRHIRGDSYTERICLSPAHCFL